jgi:endonuclease-3
MVIKDFNRKLDLMISDAKCELNYNKDYELVIATVLSAQCTDKRVNEVTKVLFSNYDIYSLAVADKKDIEGIIRSCGSYTKKSGYIIDIAKSLVENYNGVVPNDREYLESLPGVGRKTANVVLSNLYNVPCIAVDTHVERVSKRLKIARKLDSVLTVEKKLMKMIPQDLWSRSHHQLVLFGRYYCKAIRPKCADCKLKTMCKYYKKKNRRK